VICPLCRLAADSRTMSLHDNCHGCDCQHREPAQPQFELKTMTQFMNSKGEVIAELKGAYPVHSK